MQPEATPQNFQKAKIREVGGGLEVPCMFNPYEYKVSKSNSYSQKSKNDADTPQMEFSSAGSQTLSLSLIFDTYEQKEDVSQETRKLWRFMMTKTHKNSGKGKKVRPPEVFFEWGVFRFRAVITQMTQTFTMFNGDGTPLRAKVDVTFTQLKDEEDYQPQPAVKSGTTYERTWNIVAGDRLDTIAGDVYGDATQWRRIAEYNQIIDPLALLPGQRLRIPVD